MTDIKKNPTTVKGFIWAGVMNMSVLVFSKFFTNDILNQFDPEVMSNFGILMIVLWGLAYIAVARSYTTVRWLVGLFAIEKLCYGYHWISWMSSNDLAEVYEKDVLSGIFYAIYGINDLLFCCFFLYVFIKLMRSTSD